MGDVKFVDNEVVVEGSALKVTAPDIKLDTAARRSSTPGNRRALVHDFNDGLTINWADDYPGGVTVRGTVRAPVGIEVGQLSGSHLRVAHHDLHVDNASRRSATSGSRRALVHDFNDGLTINWAQDYPGGVTIRGTVRCPQGVVAGTTNVGDAVTALETQVTALEARVAALEAGSP